MHHDDAHERAPLLAAKKVAKRPRPPPVAHPPLLRDPAVRKLLVAGGFCSAFMVVELIGGVWAHSLAILTDAAHLVSDLVGFGIGIAAIFIARQPSTLRMSWGFHRAEVMGAIFSIFLIWFLTLWLVSQATERLIARDKEIDGFIMLVTASMGLVVNFTLLGLLGHHGHSHGGGGGHGHSHSHGGSGGHGHSHGHDDDDDHGHSHGGSGGHGHSHGHGHSSDDDDEKHGHGHGHRQPRAGDNRGNVNVRAATIHVIGDLIQTIIVFCAALLIWHDKKWWFCDPLCTYLFSVLVFCTTVPILKETTTILMEGTPAGLDPDDVADELYGVPGVQEVHDLHIWSIGSGKTTCGNGKVALAVHLTQDPGSKLNACDILHRAQEVLDESFGIQHTTIQIEECGTLDCPKLDAHCHQNLHTHHSAPSPNGADLEA
eukprot:EG_transcript_6135